MKKKDFKPGDIIKVNKKYHDELKNRFEEINALQVEIEKLSLSTYRKNKDIWEFLNELYPGLNSKRASYNKELNEITIKGDEE